MSRNDYFREKQVKLDAQYEATRNTKSDIFKGVIAAVDGFTEELSALEIKQILSEHGGTYAQYVWTPGITHLITSNLPTSKIRQEISKKRRSPLAVVVPKWIVDSLREGRQLPWQNYVLSQLHAPNQTTLNIWRSPNEGEMEVANCDGSSNKKEETYMAIIQIQEDSITIDAAKRKSIELNRSSVVVVADSIVVSCSRNIAGAIPIGSTLVRDNIKGGPSLEVIEYSPKEDGVNFMNYFVSVLNEIVLHQISYELLCSTEAILQSVQPFDNEFVSKLKLKIEEHCRCSIFIHINISPLDSWKIRALGNREYLKSLPCVPFRVSSQFLDISVANAYQKLGKEEKIIKKVCSGVMRREIVMDHEVEIPSCEVATVQIKFNHDRNKLSSTLLKRVLSREMFLSSSNLEKVFLSLHLLSEKRKFTAVSNLDSETLSTSISTLLNSVPEGTESSEWIRLDVSPVAKSLLPDTFSQLNSQTLKELPKEIIEDLKNSYYQNAMETSEETSIPDKHEERIFPALPTSFSQIDTNILGELPEEYRISLERELRRDNVTISSFPKSYSQVDQRTLQELPEDLRVQVETEFFENKQVFMEEDSNSRSSFPETFSQIDPVTLSELPTDVREQVRFDFKNRVKKKQQYQPKLDTMLFNQKFSKEGIELDTIDATPNKKIIEKSEYLVHQSFPKIAETISKWFDALEGCPHERETFRKPCISYVQNLFQVQELDTVNSLIMLLHRKCIARICDLHKENICWKLAMEDLSREIFRLFREEFNGAFLASWEEYSTV